MVRMYIINHPYLKDEMMIKILVLTEDAGMDMISIGMEKIA